MEKSLLGIAYKSFQFFFADIRLYANQITEHACHEVLADDDYLLTKIFDAARVRPKMYP
jgi:hypothetical protein